MSFGMIFAIILIILFVAFAIYGINKFIEVQRLAQISKLKSDLQYDINQMYLSTQGTQKETYYPPKGIKQACFQLNRQNPKTGKPEIMYFMPEGKYEGYMPENVNIQKTTLGLPSRKLCIDVINGKISLIIKKDWNDNMGVTITK